MEVNMWISTQFTTELRKNIRKHRREKEKFRFNQISCQFNSKWTQTISLVLISTNRFTTKTESVHKQQSCSLHLRFVSWQVNNALWCPSTTKTV